MRKRKQTIALLLGLLILLSLAPVSAFAEAGDEIDVIISEEAEEEIAYVEEDDGLISVIDGEEACLDDGEQAEFQAVSRSYSRLVLDVDWSLIEQVEHQQGGEACACFALAYCRTMLDGRPHQYSEFNIGTVEHAWCSWSLGSYDMRFLTDKNEAYELIFQQLTNGKPVVACVSGLRSTQHYVAFVGYENAVSGQPLSADNFLIIDSVAPYYEAENLGYIGYDLKLLDDGRYQVDCDCSSARVNYEAHSSSYLSRCEYYQSVRSLKATKSAVIRSLPCSSATDAASVQVASLASGGKFSSEALVRNPGGDYWYKGSTASGVKGYVYAGNLDEGSELLSDISFTEVEAPFEQAVGYPFYVSGKILSGKNYFQTLKASVYAGVNTENYPLMSGTVYANLHYYSLDKSSVADALQFQKLGTGYYTYQVTVTCRSYYSTDGKTLQYSEPVITLLSQGFTVGKVDSFSVTYDANGGTGAPAAQTKVRGSTLTLSSNVPVRSGYSFAGWATNRSATAANYLPGGDYSVNAPAILYAVWNKVYAKPVIQAQPRGQNVVVGGTAAFSISASGEELRYQWYYRTSDNGVWNKCTGTGADTETYSVKAESYRNGYEYRCVVKNAGGSATSYSAMLAVITNPKLKLQPSSVTAPVGKSVQFSVSGSGGSLCYQWYYRSSSSSSWQKCTGTGCTGSVYSVTVKSYRNGYQYRCKLSNAAGVSYSAAATLTVLEKPQIMSQPKSISAAEGKTVSFRVTVEGAGTYQWYYRTSSTGTWNRCTGTGCSSAVLSVVAKGYRSGYQYRCAVKNEAGTSYSSAAVLTVK